MTDESTTEVQESPEVDEVRVSNPDHVRFQLFHMHTGESTAVIEMEESLLGDPKFIDPDRMTFTNVANGNQYTLIPLEDPTVSVLSRVMDVHRRITTTPCQLPTQMFNRMDELVQIVGLMFGDVEAYVVEGIDDIAKLINPKHGIEMPPKAKRTVLGNLLDQVKAKLEARENANTPPPVLEDESVDEDDEAVPESKIEV